MRKKKTDVEQTPDAKLLEEHRKLSLKFLVQLSSLIYQLDAAERQAMMAGIVSMVTALDSLPREWEPRPVYSSETNRIIILFDGVGASDKPPVILEVQ